MDSDTPESSFQRGQLSKGMEHIRFAVTTEPVRPSDVDGTDAYGVPTKFEPIRSLKHRLQKHGEDAKHKNPFQFGSRLLAEDDDIFEFNAWDHVQVDEGYKKFAEEQYARQREAPVSDFDRNRFNACPARWWDRFYVNNASNFFKDRKWLFQEFPDLNNLISPEAHRATILEVGAGAGNSIFPILAVNRNPELVIYACDFSRRAIDLIRTNPAYDPHKIRAEVWDVACGSSSEGNLSPPGVQPGSIDVVLMIFVFSALAPHQWSQAVRNVWTVLRPGGLVLFRDYGRGDLAQVRFKKGRWMDENFYVRGDGTRVYFFEKEQVAEIWSGQPDAGSSLTCQGFKTRTEEIKEEFAGAATDSWQRDRVGGEGPEGVVQPDAILTDPGAIGSASHPDSAHRSGGLEKSSTSAEPSCSPVRPSFDVLDLGVDRRMLVNRQRRLKMHRCWIQGKFRKPLTTESRQV